MRDNGHLFRRCRMTPPQINSLFPCWIHFTTLNLSWVRYDHNRLECKIQLSDRRRFEGLFIKTFSPWVGLNTTPFAFFFILHATWRQVELSALWWDFFWSSGNFLSVSVLVDCWFWGAEVRKPHWLRQMLQVNSSELINLFKNLLLLSETFFKGNHHALKDKMFQKEQWNRRATSQPDCSRTNDTTAEQCLTDFRGKVC